MLQGLYAAASGHGGAAERSSTRSPTTSPTSTRLATRARASASRTCSTPAAATPRARTSRPAPARRPRSSAAATPRARSSRRAARSTSRSGPRATSRCAGRRHDRADPQRRASDRRQGPADQRPGDARPAADHDSARNRPLQGRRSRATATSSSTARRSARSSSSTCPAPNGLVADGDSIFSATAASGAIRTATGSTLQQNALEGSNVDMGRAMSQMMTAEQQLPDELQRGPVPGPDAARSPTRSSPEHELLGAHLQRPGDRRLPPINAASEPAAIRNGDAAAKKAYQVGARASSSCSSISSPRSSRRRPATRAATAPSGEQLRRQAAAQAA